MQIRSTTQTIYWDAIYIKKNASFAYDNKDYSEILSDYENELYSLLAGDLNSLSWENVGHGFSSARINIHGRLVVREMPRSLTPGKRCLILARAKQSHNDAYRDLDVLETSIERQFNFFPFDKYQEVTLQILEPDVTVERREQVNKAGINILFGGHAFVLDDEQAGVLTATPPMIINGIAGTGKTLSLYSCLTQSMTHWSNEEKELTYLYITENPDLLNKMRLTIFDSPLANIPNKKVHCWNFLTLISKLDPSVVDKKIVGDAHCINWLADYLKLNKNAWEINYENDTEPTWEEFITTIPLSTLCQEMRSLSGFNEEDYVNNLGKKKINSSLPANKRKWMFNQVFTAYLQHLKEEGAIHPAFYRLPENFILPDYALVLVDEGQDYSTGQLNLFAYLFKILIIGMDTNQGLTDIISQLYYLLSKKIAERSFTLIELPYNHRCAENIAIYGKWMLAIKNKLTGKADKYEAQSIKIAANLPKGRVTWTPLTWKKDRKGNIIINEVSARENYLISANTIVITTEEFKSEAEKFYGVGRVYTIKQVKGLEYDNVILYRFTESDIFKEISKVLQEKKVTLADLEKTFNRPKEESWNPEFRIPLNEVITACTRAKVTLTIRERANDYSRNYLLNLYKAAVLNQENQENIQVIAPLPAPTKDWLQELKDQFVNIATRESTEEQLHHLTADEQELFNRFKQEHLAKENKINQENSILSPFASHQDDTGQGDTFSIIAARKPLPTNLKSKTIYQLYQLWNDAIRDKDSSLEELLLEHKKIAKLTLQLKLSKAIEYNCRFIFEKLLDEPKIVNNDLLYAMNLAVTLGYLTIVTRILSITNLFNPTKEDLNNLIKIANKNNYTEIKKTLETYKTTQQKKIQQEAPAKSVSHKDKEYLKSLVANPCVADIIKLLENKNYIHFLFSIDIEISCATGFVTNTLIEHVRQKSNRSFNNAFIEALMQRNKNNKLFHMLNLLEEAKGKTGNDREYIVEINKNILSQLNLVDHIKLYNDAIIHKKNDAQLMLTANTKIYTEVSFNIIRLAADNNCLEVLSKFMNSSKLSTQEINELEQLRKNNQALDLPMSKYFNKIKIELNKKLQSLVPQLLINKINLVNVLNDEEALDLIFSTQVEIYTKKSNKSNKKNKINFIDYLLSKKEYINILLDAEKEANVSVLYLAVTRYDQNLVAFVLKNGFTNHNFEPLQYAIESNQEDVVRILLDNGVPTITENYNALCSAIEQNKVNIAKLLIERETNFNAYFKGNTVLHHAALKGKTEIASLLLEKIKDNKLLINACQQTGGEVDWPALHIAAVHDNYLMTELLLKYGANPNTGGTHTYDSPLHIAVRGENPQLIALLLRYGSKLFLNNELKSPLHIALEIGNDVIIKLFAAENINFIMHAIETDDLWFLEKIATKYDLHNEFLITFQPYFASLQVPAYKARYQYILDAYGDDSVFHNWTALHYALLFGHINIINFYLKHMPSDQTMSSSGITIKELITILMMQYPEIYHQIAHDFLQRDGEGNLVYIKDVDNPLIKHANFTENELRNKLTQLFPQFTINKENLINLLKDKDSTRLLFEIDIGILTETTDESLKNIKLIDYILNNLEYTAIFSVAQQEVNKPLLNYAIIHERSDIVKQLLEKEIFYDFIKYPPFPAAIIRNQVKIVEILLNYKLAINKATFKHPLYFAIEHNRYDIAKLLLDKGIDYKIHINGFNPLHYAVCLGNSQSVKLLLEKTNNELINELTTVGEDQFTPLHFASNEKKLVIAEELLKHKASLAILTPKHGNSALHLAAAKNDVEMIHLLFKYNATLTFNKYNQTPCHIAFSNNNEDIINAFKGKTGMSAYHALCIGDIKYLQNLFNAFKYDSYFSFTITAENSHNFSQIQNQLNYLLQVNNNSYHVLKFWTPLHLAIAYKHLDVVCFYLDNMPKDRDLKKCGISIIDLVNTLMKFDQKSYQDISNVIANEELVALPRFLPVLMKLDPEIGIPTLLNHQYFIYLLFKVKFEMTYSYESNGHQCIGNVSSTLIDHIMNNRKPTWNNVFFTKLLEKNKEGLPYLVYLLDLKEDPMTLPGILNNTLKSIKQFILNQFGMTELKEVMNQCSEKGKYINLAELDERFIPVAEEIVSESKNPTKNNQSKKQRKGHPGYNPTMYGNNSNDKDQGPSGKPTSPSFNK